MELLPTFQDISADFSFQLDLEGQVVTLRFVFNIRNQTWYLYFTDGSGNELPGIAVVSYWPLLYRARAWTTFDGDFFVQTTTDDVTSEITYDNFGTGFGLYYMTAAERETWRQAVGVD